MANRFIRVILFFFGISSNDVSQAQEMRAHEMDNQQESRASDPRQKETLIRDDLAHERKLAKLAEKVQQLEQEARALEAWLYQKYDEIERLIGTKPKWRSDIQAIMRQAQKFDERDAAREAELESAINQEIAQEQLELKLVREEETSADPSERAQVHAAIAQEERNEQSIVAKEEQMELALEKE